MFAGMTRRVCNWNLYGGGRRTNVNLPERPQDTTNRFILFIPPRGDAEGGGKRQEVRWDSDIERQDEKDRYQRL